MKITPAGGPAPAPSLPPTNPQANEARQRAINTIMKGAPQAAPTPQQHPVPDANKIAPEDVKGVLNMSQEPTEEVVEETPVIEEVQETKPAEPTPEEMALSRQFAQLARQEKALRAKEQAWKQREQELTAREQAMKQQPSTQSTGLTIEQLRANPMAILQQAGISYDELTQQAMNYQPVNPQVQTMIETLQSEIKSLRQQTDDYNKSQEQKQTAQYEAAVSQIRSDAQKLISKDDTYEAIRATNSVEDVVDLIKRTHADEGVILSVQEAAELIEQELVEEIIKTSRLKKIQQKIQPIAKADPKPQAQQTSPPVETPPQQPQMKTLTNAAGTSRKLSARERAVLAFEGKLKG